MERSNQTLYTLPEKFSLPQIYSKKFSYENASGYECVCVLGTKGKNCETNINECESNPCKFGNCVDGVSVVLSWHTAKFKFSKYFFVF